MNKRSRKVRQALFVVISLFASVSATPGAIAATGVAYDRINDRISIVVEQQALSEVLRNIGGQTGIDVRLDPRADGKVSLNIDRLPLEAALDRLGHLNVVKQYRPAGKGKKKLLVRISVLPAGKVDPDAAVRLLDADKEVDMRAMAMTASMQEMARQHAIQDDLMMQRWNLRLRDLTPAQKKHYEEQMKEFSARDAKQQQRMAVEDPAAGFSHFGVDHLTNPVMGEVQLVAGAGSQTNNCGGAVCQWGQRDGRFDSGAQQCAGLRDGCVRRRRS